MSTSSAPEGVRRVRGLMRLDRRGLLQYRGARATDLYDVIIGGRPISIPADQVLPTVDSVEALADAQQAGHIERFTTDTRVYTVTVRGEPVYLPAPRVPGWVRGLVLAATATATAASTTDAAIRALLDDPPLHDELRIRLWAAMEDDGVSIAEMARRIDVTVKTASQALRFGQWLATERAEAMVRALGTRWRASLAGFADVPGAGSRAAEPGGISRLRLILRAADRGRLAYAGPADPTRAMQAVRYPLRVGAAEVVVSAAELTDLLAGIDAFHEVGR